MPEINPEEIRQRVIAIVETFPDAEAILTAGVHLSLEVKGKRFGWFMENHHGDERICINCNALPGMAEQLSLENPGLFYMPKYVRNRAWIGIWLDTESIDWLAVEETLAEACEITRINLKRKNRKS